MNAHNGFLKEFPFIRVDCFRGGQHVFNPATNKGPDFYLLTHSHSDHLTGLDSPQFQGIVYCTEATREIVLNTVETANRVTYYESACPKPIYKFARLRTEKKRIFRTVVVNQRIAIESSHTTVYVTPIDANHCPGSVMFLIEGVVAGKTRAVLITGDICAEQWWCESIRRHPALVRYTSGRFKGFALSDGVWKRNKANNDQLPLGVRLDCIYLDTSAVGEQPGPPKDQAIQDMVELIKMYPPDYKFFINAWTWGYEDMLKTIFLNFGERVHVDWYKRKIYNLLSVVRTDVHLREAVSTDETESRFHACERRWKCDQVWGDGVGCYSYDPEDLKSLYSSKKCKAPGTGQGETSKLVYVNPVSVSTQSWNQFKDYFVKKFNYYKSINRDLPKFMIVPFARHSSVPELQHFLSAFEPRTMHPLVLPTPSSYLSLPRLYGDFLFEEGRKKLKLEAWIYMDLNQIKIIGEDEPLIYDGTAQRNIEGGQAVGIYLDKLNGLENKVSSSLSSLRTAPKRRKVEPKSSITADPPSITPKSCSWSLPSQTDQDRPLLLKEIQSSVVYPSSTVDRNSSFRSGQKHGIKTVSFNIDSYEERGSHSTLAASPELFEGCEITRVDPDVIRTQTKEIGPVEPLAKR